MTTRRQRDYAEHGEGENIQGKGKGCEGSEKFSAQGRRRTLWTLLRTSALVHAPSSWHGSTPKLAIGTPSCYWQPLNTMASTISRGFMPPTSAQSMVESFSYDQAESGRNVKGGLHSERYGYERCSQKLHSLAWVAVARVSEIFTMELDFDRLIANTTMARFIFLREPAMHVTTLATSDDSEA